MGGRRQHLGSSHPLRASTPQVDAGTVTVTLDDVNGQSEVTVTYELTTLTDAANAHLDAFAAQYPAFLQSWEQDIAASLSQRREL